MPIPYGYCHCGCGRRTTISDRTIRMKGLVRGEPRPFLRGHSGGSPRVRAEYVVDNDSGCWVWAGQMYPNGYGAWGKFYAHRRMYEERVGQIPEGLQIDHLCRNRACVNPEHMEPVTQAENLRRGRGTRLTVDQVREIRASTGTHQAAADRFGVSTSCIDAIRRGVNWKGVV